MPAGLSARVAASGIVQLRNAQLFLKCRSQGRARSQEKIRSTDASGVRFNVELDVQLAPAQ